MEAPLPIHQLIPQDPALLQHVYGVVNGIFLMSCALMFLTGVSYYRKSNFAITRRLTVSSSYLLVTLSFLGFTLYNIFYQGFSGAVSTKVLPQWVFSLSKYGAPLALASITYVLLLITEAKSYRAYRFQQKAKWYIYGLYILDAIGFVALFFMEDIEQIALFVGLLFIPHFLGAIRYCLVALKYIPYSKSLAAMFSLMALVFIEFSRLLYLRQIAFTPEVLALTHAAFAINQVFFCFVALRYGYDEVHRSLTARQHNTHQLLHDFGYALKKQEFFLTYQPQIDLKNNTVYGVEALIRWKHSKHGMVPPDHFIPLAEDTEKINDICQWVIDNSLKEVSQLYQETGQRLNLSINFSAKNLNHFMLSYLKSRMQHYQVKPEDITVEITETVMVDDDQEIQEFLEEIHNVGVELSLDDYGTGFSSLSYLTKLRISELKIDRSFIMDIDENHDNFVISHSTIAMSKSLDNKVVAEGVETEEILQTLKDIDCDYAQGYYIAKPMPVADLKQWLQESPYANTSDNNTSYII